jgi:hypothetical protein
MPAATGADTRALFVWEDDSSGDIDFATASPDDSTYKIFGDDLVVNDAEMDNDPVDLFDPASREAAKRIAQMFSGTWGVEFALSAPWFWKGVVADVSTSGSGPYDHTYSGSTPYPMRLILGVEPTGNERLLKGCVVSDCSVETSDSGVVTVSLTGAYADEEEDTPGVGSLQSQVSTDFDVLTFADGTLTFDSTTYSLVQNVSISISNNVDMIPELGSRIAADYSPKIRRTSIDWGKIVENDSQILTTYGGSSPSSPQTRVDGDDEFGGSLTFDNGKTGADQNKQVINFSGTFPDTYGRDGTGDPSADYLENMGYTARLLDDVTATNDTSTAK